METIGAIIAGVAVYVICECLKEAWLKPLQEYKRIKAEISRLLVYYANVYTSPAIYSEEDSERTKASQEFRQLAAEVIAFSEVIFKKNTMGNSSKGNFSKNKRTINRIIQSLLRARYPSC